MENRQATQTSNSQPPQPVSCRTSLSLEVYPPGPAISVHSSCPPHSANENVEVSLEKGPVVPRATPWEERVAKWSILFQTWSAICTLERKLTSGVLSTYLVRELLDPALILPQALHRLCVPFLLSFQFKLQLSDLGRYLGYYSRAIP